MPRIKQRDTRRENIRQALKTVGIDAENALTASIDATIFTGDFGEDRGRYYGISFARDATSSAADLGILVGDIVIVDGSRTETAEGNGIICSVVTKDGDFAAYIELQAEEHFGSDDILDLQYLYPDEGEGMKRRKKKGDTPQIERVIVGVVTHIVRSVNSLQPAKDPNVWK
jgi:hypothetical protein